MVVELQDKARRLVDASRELEQPDRDSFLRQACRDSAELWVQVQQLLEQGDSAPVAVDDGSSAVPHALPLAPVDPIATAGRAGKFEVVERVGAGGFGVVYKGRDPMLKRTVAIKTCTSADEGFRKRFFREAEIAARLQHPNITTVHELGIQDGVPFLVQEYLSGEDLEEMITRRDDVAIDVKLSCLEQVARGLQYAHSQGVLHRDIKPANVRLLDDGSVKIMDFGIARLLNEETRLTSTGMTVGTVGYLAPEQLKADPVDHRADIFAFGVMAYEFLAYERPFKGSNFSQVCYQLLQVDPPPLVLCFPGCDPRMSALVEKCLSKEPVDRPLDFACIEKEIRQLRRDWTPGSAPIFATADIDPEGVTELFDTGAEPILRASAGAPAKTVVQRGGTAVVSEEPAVSGSSTARSQRGSSPYSQPMANQGRAGGARGALLVGLALVGAVAVALALWWMLAGSGGAASRSAVEGTSLAEHSQDVSTSLPTGQQGMDQPAERPTMGDGGALANQGGVDLVVEGAGVATRSQSGSEDSAASGTASPPAQRPVSSVARDRSQLSKDAPSRSQPAKQPASPTKVPAESSATQSTPSATAGERADAATGSGAQREPPPTQPAQQDAETATKAKAAPGPRVATADPGALPAGRQSGSKSETLSQTSPPAASRVETPAGPIQPGTEDRKPIPIARERPDYPERARRRRVEARVVVAVLVNAEGQVERAILKQRDDSSLGFNEAAIAAAKKTRFQPATRDGVAGAMWTELPFDFRLR